MSSFLNQILLSENFLPAASAPLQGRRSTERAYIRSQPTLHSLHPKTDREGHRKLLTTYSRPSEEHINLVLRNQAYARGKYDKWNALAGLFFSSILRCANAMQYAMLGQTDREGETCPILRFTRSVGLVGGNRE
jgi:hypothetical protein